MSPKDGWLTRSYGAADRIAWSSAPSRRSPASMRRTRVRLATAVGDADFRIVGIATNQQEEGTAFYVPLTTDF
jgi:hypothetical protein